MRTLLARLGMGVGAVVAASLCALPALSGTGNYCSNTAFSTGLSTISSNSLTISIAANDLVLSADNLPTQPGIFIASFGQSQIPLFNGNLCVSPQGLQRLKPVSTPVGGVATLDVDLTSSASTPSGTDAPVNVFPNGTYNFQRWNRDPAAGGGNANFSDAIEILFIP